jgi:5-methylcytosine-specific restriction endonuclease McrA
MCRGKVKCEILGSDPSKWSKICPLPLPEYFETAVDHFSKAVTYLAKGKLDESLHYLEQCNSDAVGKFFIEHGQQSSYFRVANRKEIDRANLLVKATNKTPRLMPKMENEVFIRDSYHCRYCGIRIVEKDVFAEYSRIVGTEKFSTKRENDKRNGLTLGLRGVADHVEPYASGGETQIDNLVTSCYSCNFGKAGYTLEQLRIEDPRLRPPIPDSWRGLTEHLPALRSIK